MATERETEREREREKGKSDKDWYLSRRFIPTLSLPRNKGASQFPHLFIILLCFDNEKKIKQTGKRKRKGEEK